MRSSRSAARTTRRTWPPSRCSSPRRPRGTSPASRSTSTAASSSTDRPPQEAPMNVGISVPLPAYLVDVGAMARTAEALGFESFWCAEHPFIPVHTTSRFPGTADGVIPEAYSHFIDPFVALARASGTTSRIKLATGIVLVPERHPLLLAKEVSTLDLFSGGRFLFCSRAGGLRGEAPLLGGPFRPRCGQHPDAITCL